MSIRYLKENNRLIPEAQHAASSVGGEFECLGSALMQGGYTFPRLMGDYPALQLDIVQIKKQEKR